MSHIRRYNWHISKLRSKFRRDNEKYDFDDNLARRLQTRTLAVPFTEKCRLTLVVYQ